jgi:hypothetical protein
MEAASVSRYVAILNWFRSMPDWFKATITGGALAASAFILFSLFADDALASDVEALKHKAATTQNELRNTHEALIRIERKLDTLILKLVDTGD